MRQIFHSSERSDFHRSKGLVRLGGETVIDILSLITYMEFVGHGVLMKS